MYKVIQASTRADDALTISILNKLIHSDSRKLQQLLKVKDITLEMTSDTGVTITEEIYSDDIHRCIIEGTRANMVVTYIDDENGYHIISRKPRNIELLYRNDFHAYIYDDSLEL